MRSYAIKKRFFFRPQLKAELSHESPRGHLVDSTSKTRFPIACDIQKRGFLENVEGVAVQAPITLSLDSLLSKQCAVDFIKYNYVYFCLKYEITFLTRLFSYICIQINYNHYHIYIYIN